MATINSIYIYADKGCKWSKMGVVYSSLPIPHMQG